MRLCSVEDCYKKHRAKGYCKSHYKQYKRRYKNEWNNFKYPLKSDFIKFRNSKNKKMTRKEYLDILSLGQQFLFFSIVFGNKDSCWIWPYKYKLDGNYKSPSNVSYRGKSYSPPRLALILSKGSPPSDKNECAHDPVLCNNSLCCNPAHLRWASRAENHADMRIAGTVGVGEKNARAVLTEEQVKNILRDNRKQTDIALDYNVSSAMIHLIKTRKRWAHVQI